MIVLVYDTETTGFTNNSVDPTHPSQPDLVQMGAILIDLVSGRVRGEINLIAKPEGRFTVPERAAEVHGVTTEVAEKYGVPLVVIMAAFNNLARLADAFVCHNAAYDTVVVRKAYHLVQKPHPFDLVPSLCTMKLMTPIMLLPPTERMRAKGMFRHKTPSLMEAYGFVTDGGTFDNAHDAMADVRATVEVYRWLFNREQRAKNPVDVLQEFRAKFGVDPVDFAQWCTDNDVPQDDLALNESRHLSRLEQYVEERDA